MPKSWKIYYEDESGEMKPVSATSAYGTREVVGNTVSFRPVTTKKLKLEINLPDNFSTGIYEWEVK